MTRPAGQPHMPQTRQIRRLLGQTLHTLPDRHRRRIPLRRHRDGHLLGVRRFRRRPPQLHLRRRQRFHPLIPKLAAQLHPPRYHIPRVGMHFHTARRTHPAHLHFPGDAPHGQRHLRRRRHRIPPQRHRRGAGVVRLPHNVNVIHRPPGNPRYDADGTAAPVQRRPLLNVQLQIARQLLRPPPRRLHPRHIPPDVRQPRRQRCPVVRRRRKILRLPQPGHRPTAQQPAVKTGAFLVGEHHHLQRMPQPLPGVLQRLRRLNGGDDPQRAVILPPRRHRIRMRTQRNGRQPRLAAFPPPDDIAGPVHPHRQPGGAHQLRHIPPPGDVKLRKRHPLHPRIRQPDLPQSRQPVVQTRRINRRRRPCRRYRSRPRSRCAAHIRCLVPCWLLVACPSSLVLVTRRPCRQRSQPGGLTSVIIPAV